MTEKWIPAWTKALLESPTIDFSSDSFSEGSEDGTAVDTKFIKDNNASKWSTKSKDENET